MNYPDLSEETEKKEILFQNEILEKGLKSEFLEYTLNKTSKGLI